MNDTYLWLTGWYATRLHAVPSDVELPAGISTVTAICGHNVFGKPPTDWAQRALDKGVPHCKRCEKRIAK